MTWPITYLLLPLAAYSLGAVPFGLLLCQLVKGVDIREHGSKNIGATNAGRVCGLPFFFAAFALDFGKGLVPVLVGRMVVLEFIPGANEQTLMRFAVAYGALAILGHTFPAPLSFKGGKAVATSFGVFVGLAPTAALIAFGVWAAFFVATRYVSFASLAAALAAPLAYGLLHRADLADRLPVFAFTCLIAVVIAVRHVGNIRRLLHGTENRFQFHRKSD